MKDIDFERNEIMVREGKGAKDRVTMLPGVARALLYAHLQKVRLLTFGRFKSCWAIRT
ncbi:MAG: hypothetical protein ABR556_10465 [Pyrinomonadaceae bacterium]